MKPFVSVACILVAALWLTLPAAEASESPGASFTNDVMPVLSRAGCNAGGCHGHRDGKGGFKLSLWGENPESDFASLHQEREKPLIHPANPAASRLLLKPTMQADHKGGERFEIDSPEYHTLLRWLEGGAQDDTESAPALESLVVSPEFQILSEPERSVQLEVTAHFEDGTSRDVSYWSVYSLSNLVAEVTPDGLVTFPQPGEATVIVRYLDKRVSTRLIAVPSRPDFAWNSPDEANYIDRHVFRKLRTLRMNPSGRCDDATFVRRVYLDILGALPTAEEARAFVQSTAPDKRAALIDELLERPEYAEFWALKWSDLLRNEEKTLDRTGVEKFHGWLRDSLADGKGLDQFARELITARGSTYSNPPANYYRALRKPDERAEATAQVFLGARLRCAKCHNHPFDRWTQDEYYQFAALFDGIEYKIIENKRRDKYDKNQFVGEQEVQLVAKREFKDPRTEKPPTPRLLGAETPSLEEDRDRFEQLAEWITAPENELFAKVQANRIWFNMMGRGLVEPVDDFRATNPPSHPELLDALAQDFIEHGYDLRHLVRRIANSQTYQLASVPNETNAEDEINYARAITNRLPAEVLLDALHAALDSPLDFKNYDNVKRATALPGIEGAYLDKNPHADDRFLKLFGKPPRLINSDAERLNDTSLAQVFELTSGETMGSLLGAEGNRLATLLESSMTDGERVETLYWSTVSRAPTSEESKRMTEYLHGTSGPAKRRALEDIAWALLNSKEFMFRH